jgi:hypothetical protein
MGQPGAKKSQEIFGRKKTAEIPILIVIQPLPELIEYTEKAGLINAITNSLCQHNYSTNCQ